MALLSSSSEHYRSHYVIHLAMEHDDARRAIVAWAHVWSHSDHDGAELFHVRAQAAIRRSPKRAHPVAETARLATDAARAEAIRRIDVADYERGAGYEVATPAAPRQREKPP
jgi:hypothetical protein